VIENVMRKLRIYLGLTLAALVLSASVVGQTTSWPRFRKGESYAGVRSKLLRAGWKPYRRNDADPYYDENEKELRARYLELNTCSGTGMGYCTFTWRDPKGKRAIITTVGGGEFHYNSRAYVTQ